MKNKIYRKTWIYAILAMTLYNNFINLLWLFLSIQFFQQSKQKKQVLNKDIYITYSLLCLFECFLHEELVLNNGILITSDLWLSGFLACIAKCSHRHHWIPWNTLKWDRSCKIKFFFVFAMLTTLCICKKGTSRLWREKEEGSTTTTFYFFVFFLY